MNFSKIEHNGKCALIKKVGGFDDIGDFWNAFQQKNDDMLKKSEINDIVENDTIKIGEGTNIEEIDSSERKKELKTEKKGLNSKNRKVRAKEIDDYLQSTMNEVNSNKRNEMRLEEWPSSEKSPDLIPTPFYQKEHRLAAKNSQFFFADSTSIRFLHLYGQGIVDLENSMFKFDNHADFLLETGKNCTIIASDDQPIHFIEMYIY